MYVIPAKGFKIRDPLLKDFLPEGGREVPDDLYWERMVLDKDVSKGKNPEAAEAKALKTDKGEGK